MYLKVHTPDVSIKTTIGGAEAIYNNIILCRVCNLVKGTSYKIEEKLAIVEMMMLLLS